MSKTKLKRIYYGTMGLGGGWDEPKITKKSIEQAEKALQTALSIGITKFDLADIYQNGKSEEVFGAFLKNNSNIRKEIIVQTKVGIILKNIDGVARYDFSEKHIIDSVKASLKRLNTDYIDTLLLHRPDPLMNIKDLKNAFQYLLDHKIVKKIGVSNMNQYQIEYIKKSTNTEISINQLEISLKKLDWLDSTIGINNDEGFKSSFTPGLLEYMMTNNIEIQAWSPMAGGLYTGKNFEILDEKESIESISKTKKYIYKLAQEKNTTPDSIVLSFILKHPSNINPVIGTSNPERIKLVKDCETIELTRKEWYKLYTLSRNKPLP